MPDTPIPFPLTLVRLPIVGGVVERVLMSPASLRMMVRRGVGRPAVRISGQAYVGDRQQADAIRSIFALSLRNLRALYAPTKEALGLLDIPAFVAWGSRDPFFDVSQGRRVADAIRGAPLTVFDGAGHFLPKERPQEIADLISDMIRFGVVE